MGLITHTHTHTSHYQSNWGITWRACRNSLPTKCNLVHRQVLTDHHYDRCSTSQEDILHALWSCPELDGVWDAAEWNFRS